MVDAITKLMARRKAKKDIKNLIKSVKACRGWVLDAEIEALLRYPNSIKDEEYNKVIRNYLEKRNK